MSAAPPIISPRVHPPPIPPHGLQKYINRCKVLCIVAASLFLVGLAGFVLLYVETGKANWGAFGFGVWYVVMGYAAAVLLHRRKTEAYLAALACLVVMLLLIPVGTVLGILGIGWLNKGRPLLTRR